MYGLPVLVSAGPPGVVPEAAPVALLLVADDFGNLARASNDVRKDFTIPASPLKTQ